MQNATGTLAIEIGGTAAGEFDKLLVGGLAVLNNGMLNVSLINGFIPAPTDTFQILLATTSLGTNTRFGNTTAAPNNILTFAGGSFKVNYVYGANGTITLSNFTAGGVPGDYNGNGVVDAVDYVLWRNALGTNVTPGTGADGDGNGIIEQSDYTFWRAHRKHFGVRIRWFDRNRIRSRTNGDRPAADCRHPWDATGNTSSLEQSFRVTGARQRTNMAESSSGIMIVMTIVGMPARRSG